jgi:L-asparaginase II
VDHRLYVRPDHWLQREVAACLEAVTGAKHGAENRAIDGCSIPTYAVPLRSLALGFARMATGKGFGAERARAARRLMAACMAEPFYVAGTGRADTRLMELAQGRLFTKTGAEGVYCAALPELGVGIAVKCDDGAGRAAEVAVASVAASLLPDGNTLAEKLRAFARPGLTNWNGIAVGEITPAGPIA